MEPTPLKTFIIYAHEDRSTVNAIRGQLRIFEKKEVLQIWDDGEILAGQDWDKSIKLKLESAQLILLFISVDFLNSEYIEKTELQAALQRHREEKAKLIPIIVRRCPWEEYFELGKFQALPPNAKPILSHDLHSLDEAYYAVALGIKAAADEMQQKIAAAEKARQEELERETRQKTEAEKQKQKNERLKKQDEIAWKTALAAIEKVETERGKMNALEVYLEEPQYQLHREEAEQQLEKLHAAETARKIEEKHRGLLQNELGGKKRAIEPTDPERKEKFRALVTALSKSIDENEKTQPEMVLVRGGTFQMVSYDYEYDDEKNIHSVTLTDFEIGKYPVTQKLWQEIMGNNPSHFQGCEDCPVESVSWDDVQEFLEKLNKKYPGKNYRLPSEAEWEYAACGGQQSKWYFYAGSNDIDEVAWYAKNSGRKTHPVGGKKANELGIYDMSGNVSEWCQDAWHSNYGGAPTDGSPWDRQGKDVTRVVRGGAWNDGDDRSLMVSYRDGYLPDARNNGFGFRLARH
ncbi:SUMF1/EgtB/PvdO family nonheme iron enzyme [Haliscomenobacter sp.]|uniref:SUMF1/EgtB/PvdO family nonheme iron enzyme n=1 Tax=Haliscomenobacter sp. TaxID=2717303 RepID=UPI003BA95497